VCIKLAVATAEQPSKSHAKVLKTKAEKAWKKRPSPDGKAKIEEGSRFMSKENNDLSKACKLFIEAEALCNSFDCGLSERAPSKVVDVGIVDTRKGNESMSLAPKLPVLSEPWSRVAKESDGVLEADSLAINSPRVLSECKGAEDGIWRTRFPPEPNGYLHVGHAKAMHFDFCMAEGRGETYLRFDDTNPSAEKTEYIDSILDSISWLGYTPSRVTYTSDYFHELYDLAIRLIREGGAYVCHMTKEEVEASRDKLEHFHVTCHENGMTKEEKKTAALPHGVESPWRDRQSSSAFQLLKTRFLR
jgi:glutaminyl-tRNA synthetase